MLAAVANDLRGWFRTPQAVLVSLLVPLVVLVLPLLAGTVGTGYTVAIVADQPTRVRAALESSAYLRTVTMSRDEAAVAVARGDVVGSFDTRDGTLVLSVAPYGNDDVRRNLVMRQQAILAEVNTALLAETGSPHVALTERGLVGATPSDQAYLAAGALVFVALFSGLANTAFATSREWDRGTVRLVLTSPVPLAAGLAAKLLTGVLRSLVGVGVSIGVVTLVVGVHPVGEVRLLAGVLVATVIGAAALGLVVGVVFARIVPAVLFSVVAGLLAWFVGGGFAPVTLQPEALRLVGAALPSTHAISAGVRLFTTGAAPGVELWVTFLAAGLSVVVAPALATSMVRRNPMGRGA